MTNPTPRPALRKAEDATIHPAAPRPARSPKPSPAKAAPAKAAPVVEQVAPVVPVAPVVEAEPSPSKKKRKFGGATSDHLRVDADDAPSKKKSSTKKAAESTRDDLMQGKPTDLEVEVPKALRKAAAKKAKAEGLDLQTVVIDALHAYVTQPPR